MQGKGAVQPWVTCGRAALVTLTTLGVMPTRERLQAACCVPRILGRKISKGFLTQMNYIPRHERICRWDCWPAGIHLCEIVENGKLPGSWREINVLISPKRGKKVEFVRELTIIELHADLDKEL